MRKLPIIVVMLLLSAAAVIAVECTDTDNGPTSTSKPDPFIGERGVVKYGIMEKADTCISNQDGYHLEGGIWLREYFCANVSGEVQRTYEDYDCTRYGYTICNEGKCTGKTGTGSSSTPRVATGPSCGNKKVDSGEQCDPPDSICYLNDVIGICTKANAQGFGGCQCKLYKGGSSTTTAPVETTTVTTTPPPVVTPPPAPTPAPTTPPAAEQPPAQAPEPAETPKERAPLPTEDLNSNGIGITRGISNAVKRFFSWIGSWFG
jgi:hypothetical protein